MKKIDIISGVLIFLFGLTLLFVIIPLWVPTPFAGDYGLLAKDMPNVAAVTVTGLAVIFLAAIFSGKVNYEDMDVTIHRENWVFLSKATIFLIFVMAIIEWGGFLAAGPITVGGFMYYMGVRKPFPLLATAISAPLAIWLFFWQLLRFPLP